MSSLYIHICITSAVQTVYRASKFKDSMWSSGFECQTEEDLNQSKFNTEIFDLTVSRDLSLFEKLPVTQLLKKFPTFHGTLKFIIIFTRAL
jgi:hypothetical protein